MVADRPEGRRGVAVGPRGRIGADHVADHHVEVRGLALPLAERDVGARPQQVQRGRRQGRRSRRVAGSSPAPGGPRVVSATVTPAPATPRRAGRWAPAAAVGGSPTPTPARDRVRRARLLMRQAWCLWAPTPTRPTTRATLPPCDGTPWRWPTRSSRPARLGGAGRRPTLRGAGPARPPPPAVAAAAAGRPARRRRPTWARACAACSPPTSTRSGANPLALLRSAVRYPTDGAGRRRGAAGARATSQAVRLFPDDAYDLGPATFADLHPSVHEPGLVWGAAKAHVVLARRRRGRGPRCASCPRRGLLEALPAGVGDRARLEEQAVVGAGEGRGLGQRRRGSAARRRPRASCGSSSGDSPARTAIAEVSHDADR